LNTPRRNTLQYREVPVRIGARLCLTVALLLGRLKAASAASSRRPGVKRSYQVDGD